MITIVLPSEVLRLVLILLFPSQGLVTRLERLTVDIDWRFVVTALVIYNYHYFNTQA